MDRHPPDIERDEETVLAQEILEAGVPKSRVKEIFRGRIPASILHDLVQDDRDDTGTRNPSVDPNIKRLVDEMKAPENFRDPLYLHLMRDPVLLSSGMIYDRSSVVDGEGHVKFRKCPLTGKPLTDSIVALKPTKKEIERYKATRDRNVVEIARKMIASGDYDSFHLVLEGVEHYVRGLGENYLPLARELAAMWSGVREASCIMLLVEKIDHSRGFQTVVASGGLQDKTFRIIVSAEYYRDQSWKHNNRNGLFLSLYNDRDQIVERYRLFGQRRSYGRSSMFYEVLGKHDFLVTKSKPGYSYKLEFKAPDDGSVIDVQGFMCKIFPESCKKASYRMEDAQGEQGIFMGSVDLRNNAHGQGVLDYDDGKRFVGTFHNGSITDGVLYRGAHVTCTLRNGQWDESIDESLVQKHKATMLVYDPSDRSRSRTRGVGGVRPSYNGYNSKTSRVDDDMRSHRSELRPHSRDIDRSGYNSFHSRAHEDVEETTSRRGGYHRYKPSTRPGGMDFMNEDDFDSVPIGGVNGATLPALRGKKQFIDDIDDTYSISSNVRSHGGVQSKYFDDNDIIEVERSIASERHRSGVRSKSTGSAGSRRSFNEKRNDILKGLQHHFEKHEEEHGLYPIKRGAHSDDLGGFFDAEPGGKNRIRRDDGVVSLHSGLHGNKYVDGLDRIGEIGNFTHFAGSHVSSRTRKKIIPGSVYNEEDTISILSDNWNTGQAGSSLGIAASPEADRSNSRIAGRKSGSLLGIIGEEDPLNNPERMDQEDTFSRRSGQLSRQNQLGTLFEEDVVDSRDVLNSSRSEAKIPERPMLLMVDQFVKHSKGGIYKKLVKGGTLQDGVHCVLVSAENFHSAECMAQVMLTLCDHRKEAIERIDLFGKSQGKASSPFRLIGENEPIISKAKPGFSYQLEYKIKNGHEDTITLAGLICKIIPAGRATPSFETTDPEGLRGRYMGKIDINGNAGGRGTFHYESGCTFVGEFNRGKWTKGVYYRGTEIKGTMKGGKWDTDQFDIGLTKEFPYDVHFFPKIEKSKASAKSIMTKDEYESAPSSSFSCCLW